MRKSYRSVTLNTFLRPWVGPVIRHIPAGSPYDVLDFRFSGLSEENRWNRPGEPTLYLANQTKVAVTEFGRRMKERLPGLSPLTHERAFFQLDVRVDALFDLRNSALCQFLSLGDAPSCFSDKEVARSIAGFIRHTTPAQAIQVPSMGFTDDVESHWNLVLFLEKLLKDPRSFVTATTLVGRFHVEWL